MHSGHFSKLYLSSLFVKFISSNNYYMLFFHLLFVLLSKTFLLPSFHSPSSFWYNKVWIILFAINNLIHSSTEASLVVSCSWVVCLLLDCANMAIDCFFIPDPQSISIGLAPSQAVVAVVDGRVQSWIKFIVLVISSLFSWICLMHLTRFPTHSAISHGSCFIWLGSMKHRPLTIVAIDLEH